MHDDESHVLYKKKNLWVDFLDMVIHEEIHCLVLANKNHITSVV